MAEKTRVRKVLLLIAALAIMYGTFIAFESNWDLVWQHNLQLASLGVWIVTYLLSFYCVYRSRSVFACGFAAVYSVILFATGIFGRFIAWFFPWANALYYCDLGYGDSLYFLIVAVATCACWLFMLIMKKYKLGIWKEPGEDSGRAILRQQIEEIGREKFHKRMAAAAIGLVGVVVLLLVLFIPFNVDYECLCESSCAAYQDDWNMSDMYVCRTLEECKTVPPLGNQNLINADTYNKIANSVDFDKYFVLAVYNFEVDNIIYNNFKVLYHSGYDYSILGCTVGKLTFKESEPKHKAYIYVVDKSHIQDVAYVLAEYYNGKFTQDCDYIFHDVNF